MGASIVSESNAREVSALLGFVRGVKVRLQPFFWLCNLFKRKEEVRWEVEDSRSRPVTTHPMVSVILKRWVTEVGSTSLSYRGWQSATSRHIDRGGSERTATFFCETTTHESAPRTPTAVRPDCFMALKAYSATTSLSRYRLKRREPYTYRLATTAPQARIW